MVPPARLIDLTSDFFEAANHNNKKNKTSLVHGIEPPEPREKRLIVNNPRQNAIMVDLGKCRI
jgi:hypothetical protein